MDDEARHWRRLYGIDGEDLSEEIIEFTDASGRSRSLTPYAGDGANQQSQISPEVPTAGVTAGTTLHDSTPLEGMSSTSYQEIITPGHGSNKSDRDTRIITLQSLDSGKSRDERANQAANEKVEDSGKQGSATMSTGRSSPSNAYTQPSKGEDKGGQETKRRNGHCRLKALCFLDDSYMYNIIMTWIGLSALTEIVIGVFEMDPFQPWTIPMSMLTAAIVTLELSIRIFCLWGILRRSKSNLLDLTASIVLLLLIVWRVKAVAVNGEHASLEGTMYGSIYVTVCALRLLAKPYTRGLSRKILHLTEGDDILISVEGVRNMLDSLPGITVAKLEALDVQLMIASGRLSGMMSGHEFLSFLESALPHRPSGMSVTSFLEYMQQVDAKTKHAAYGVFDVIQSTLWHWSAQRLDLFLAFVVVCINASVPPIQAFLISYITDNAVAASQVDADSEQALVTGMVLLIVICVPYILSNLGIGYYQAKMIAHGTKRIQVLLSDIILSQGNLFFASYSEGDLNNLFTSDIARVNALWQAVFWNLLTPLVQILFAASYIFMVRPDWGIYSLAFIAVLVAGGPQKRASEESKEFVAKNAYAAADFQNAVACQTVVRAYDIRKPFLRKFEDVLRDLCKSSVASQFWATVVQVYITGAMYTYVAVQIAALAYVSFYNDTSLGTFTGLVSLYQGLATPVITLGGFMRWAIGNSGSLQRLDNVIRELYDDYHTDEGPDDEDALPSLPKMTTVLEVEGIVFRYDMASPQLTLNNVTFSIKKGSYTCLCGSSGSGKSTMLGVLLTFLSPEMGKLKLDGHDISRHSIASYRKQIAVVFQNALVLNGTILENIRYGCMDATDEECRRAAQMAEIDSFIETLPLKYNTVVGQHATWSLSGGQCQRICLARALVRNPSILLLDEATSALDPKTEASIVRTLERLSQQDKMTIISVTHRFQTAINADQIIMMQDGTVVEIGRYKELLSQGGPFAAMAASRRTETTPDLGDAEDEALLGKGKEVLYQFYKNLKRKASTGVRQTDSTIRRGSFDVQGVMRTPSAYSTHEDSSLELPVQTIPLSDGAIGTTGLATSGPARSREIANPNGEGSMIQL